MNESSDFEVLTYHASTIFSQFIASLTPKVKEKCHDYLAKKTNQTLIITLPKSGFPAEFQNQIR